MQRRKLERARPEELLEGRVKAIVSKRKTRKGGGTGIGGWCKDAPTSGFESNKPSIGMTRRSSLSFSTVTVDPRPFSTVTVESFHDYKRMHSICAVYCNHGINMNSILTIEKVRGYIFRCLF